MTKKSVSVVLVFVVGTLGAAIVPAAAEAAVLPSVSISQDASCMGDGYGTAVKSNLRNKPSLKGKVLRTVPAQAYLCVRAGSWKEDSRGVPWIPVTYKGTSGWISSRVISAG